MAGTDRSQGSGTAAGLAWWSSPEHLRRGRNVQATAAATEASAWSSPPPVNAAAADMAPLLLTEMVGAGTRGVNAMVPELVTLTPLVPLAWNRYPLARTRAIEGISSPAAAAPGVTVASVAAALTLMVPLLLKLTAPFWTVDCSAPCRKDLHCRAVAGAGLGRGGKRERAAVGDAERRCAHRQAGGIASNSSWNMAFHDGHGRFGGVGRGRSRRAAARVTLPLLTMLEVLERVLLGSASWPAKIVSGDSCA